MIANIEGYFIGAKTPKELSMKPEKHRINYGPSLVIYCKLTSHIKPVHQTGKKTRPLVTGSLRPPKIITEMHKLSKMVESNPS